MLLPIFSTLLLLLGSTLTLAAPFLEQIQQDDPLRTFSLEVPSRTSSSKRDFVREWTAARMKYGGAIPDGVNSMFRLADSDGRVDVEPLGTDDIYIADVKVGSPPQTLKMALDTGSSDLWVQSSDTIYRSNAEGPWAPQYMPNKSHSAHLIKGAEWDVQYVDGTGANGIVYLDTVRMGPFKVENATIQSAQIIASRFESEPGLTGVLGLAKSLPSNIDPPLPSFLDNLRKQLDRPVFTVDVRTNATGRFDFGHINHTLASENITWLDTDPDSVHWDVEFDLTSWTSGERVWWYHKFTATIDTGTTLMFMPDVLASMYWLSVPTMKLDPRLSDAYTFLCSAADDLPDLQFKLKGTEHVIKIPGRYMNYGPIEDSPGYCWGGMQSTAGMEVAILGDTMLKALFVAFDLEKGRVGFANKELHDE